jgi:hypothetical protein
MTISYTISEGKVGSSLYLAVSVWRYIVLIPMSSNWKGIIKFPYQRS